MASIEIIDDEVIEELQEAFSSQEPGQKKATFVIMREPVWDPLSSPDWDKEKHRKEAIVRIKRYTNSHKFD